MSWARSILFIAMVTVVVLRKVEFYWTLRRVFGKWITRIGSPSRKHIIKRRYVEAVGMKLKHLDCLGNTPINKVKTITYIDNSLLVFPSSFDLKEFNFRVLCRHICDQRNYSSTKSKPRIASTIPYSLVHIFWCETLFLCRLKHTATVQCGPTEREQTPKRFLPIGDFTKKYNHGG